MKRVLILILACCVASLTTADLVDDFESYDTGPVSTVVTDGSWLTDTTDDDAVIEVDPADVSNQVMSTVEAGGTGGAGQTGSYAVLDSTTSIPDGTTKTLFLRCRINTTTTDQAIGLTSVDAPTIHGAGDWNEFHACFRFTAGYIDVRDGGTWLTNLNDRALTLDTWYYLWFVVHNETGATTDYVELYVNSTGVDATEADKKYNTSNGDDTFGFRVQDAETLDRIYWRAQDGSEPIDKVYIDDVHISDGIDLSVPANLKPYSPNVIQGTPSGSDIPTTLQWKAGVDPDGIYAVNPAIVDQSVFIGTDLDPNLVYVGNTNADPGTDDPNSQYSFTGTLDRTYYWAVVEELTGYEQTFNPGDNISLVDPNNIIGSTWSYEAIKSSAIITGNPANARVFTTDPNAVFTVTFTSAINPVTAIWYKDDAAITPGGDVSVSTDPFASSTLTIDTPILSDEGKYYCILSTDAGSTEDDRQTATRLLVIKQTLAEYNFEQNLNDTGDIGAEPGKAAAQGKQVTLPDANELLATNVALTYVNDGIDGYAVHLDGTQYIDLDPNGYPKAGPLDTFGDVRGDGYEKQGFGRGMDEGSILCWIRPTTTGAIITNANGSDDTHFGLTSGSTNNIRHIVRGDNWDGSYQELGTTEGSLDMTDFSLQDGEWHMFAATWDDSGVRAYLNGEQVAGPSYSGFPEVYTPWERSNLIGASRSLSPGRWILNSLYTGDIDSLRIYNYVISAEDIAAEYETLNQVGVTPCLNHDFDGSDININNTVSSYCKIDLGDFALIAEKWLNNGFTAP